MQPEPMDPHTASIDTMNYAARAAKRWLEFGCKLQQGEN